MGSSSLLSHPVEDLRSVLTRKTTTTCTKFVKPTKREAKRINPKAPTAHHCDPNARVAGTDRRRKRVWRACASCRTKKSKCDGEFPCQRCKQFGLICTPGLSKKVEFKQSPKGYTQVLESSQYALTATIHKLYAMVRNNQHWDLGEPELNDRGQPIIHDIAQMFGFILPHSDIDIPVHSVFPQDEAGMAELAYQLVKLQQNEPLGIKQNDPPAYRTAQDEFLQSDAKQNSRNATFSSDSGVKLSPSSFTDTSELEFGFGPDVDASTMFHSQSLPLPHFSDWNMVE